MTRPLNESDVPAPSEVDVQAIPEELKARPQWVVWKWGKRRTNGRYDKEPYSLHNGRHASDNTPATWVMFDVACHAYRTKGYDGIGFMLTADDPYVVIDFDHAFQEGGGEQKGELRSGAAEVVNRFQTYTEYSPSRTGLHLILALPPKTGKRKKRQIPVEVMYAEHFVTLTGQLLRPELGLIAPCQERFDAWENETFAPPASHVRQFSAHTSRQRSPRIEDEEVLNHVRRAANGEKFLALWNGSTNGYPSQSEADLALIGMLAFWTRNPAQLDQLFRQSKLYRPKWDKAHGATTYGEMTIEKALQSCQSMAQQQRSRTSPNKRGGLRSVTHIHEWQGRAETPEERVRYLDELAKGASARVDEHLRTQQPTPLAIIIPPGVGKTRECAKLGSPPRSLAWIAPRHDLYPTVAAQAPYIHIQPCTSANCPDADTLNLVAALGNRVWPAHKAHACAYYRQFQVAESAFYVGEMVATPFPQRHEGAIIDELDLSSWLETQTITLDDLTRARQDARWGAPQYAPVQQLLRALYETLLEARNRARPLHARSLFIVLDESLSGRQQSSLCDLLSVLERLKVAAELRPTVRTAEEIDAALRSGTVMVPQVVCVLLEDRPKWLRGTDWNSRMHIDADGRLHILSPRRFPELSKATGEPWPVAVLDATADETLLSRLWGRPVQVARQEVIPPPHMRHIAVRIRSSKGKLKRYGIQSLVKGKHAAGDRDRVIRELTTILARINPQSTRTVGLITYQGCQDPLGEALGIPPERRGHFWNLRGSNAWEDCGILLVVGTPVPNLSQVEWMARALYMDDPVPIDTIQTRQTDPTGGSSKEYHDARLAGLVNHLITAELTQAAHRNRPLRHDGRIVVTLTAGEVNFLPITEEITSLGSLPTAQRTTQREHSREAQCERLEAAYATLLAEHKCISGRALATAAHVRRETATQWLQQRVAQDQAAQETKPA